MLFCDMNLYNVILIVEIVIFIFMIGFITGQLYNEYVIDSKSELNISENMKNVIIDSQTRKINKLKKELDFTQCQIESLQYGTNENIIMYPYKNN